MPAKALTPAERRAVLAWYGATRRDLPWRRTSDPYAIWVSEVMLQQTQVKPVLPRYEAWMRRFPDVRALAEADEQEVLSLWQGLGYYRRCTQLIRAASLLAETGFPQEAEEWERLPGVGPNTAAAIASIAFGRRAAVVDGNVQRVFARIAACRESGSALLVSARAWATASMDETHPGDWNQAMMELGATLCKPMCPECPRCPLATRCSAHRRGLMRFFPKGRPASKPERRYRLVWAPYHSGAFGLTQIPSGRWSQGMWEFPGVDLPRPGSEGTGESDVLRAVAGTGWLERLGDFHHTITRHRIHVELWLLRADERSEALRWVDSRGMARVPLPSAALRAYRLACERLGLRAPVSPVPMNESAFESDPGLR